MYFYIKLNRLQGKLKKTNGEVVETKINKNNEVGEIHYPMMFSKVKYAISDKSYEVWSDYSDGINYEKGQQIEIYYNVENPNEIHIKPNQQKNLYLVFIIVGTLITFGTLLIKFTK